MSQLDEQDVKRISFNMHSAASASASPHHAEDHASRHATGGADELTSSMILEAATKRVRETSGPTTLAWGAVSDGQFIKRSGTGLISAAVGLDFNVLDIVTGDTTVTGSTETALYSGTITGGTLGTNNTVLAIVHISDLDMVGANNLVLRMKYGNTPTTIATATYTDGGGGLTNATSFIILAMHADGATNAQLGSINWLMASSLIHATGTAAIDSTTNQAFTLTADFNGAGDSITLAYAIGVQWTNA